MDNATLEAEAQRLILPCFDETIALQLGAILLELAEGKPVVINIRNGHRTFFHAALPGSQANNDNWARRKGNTALMMGAASMQITLRYRDKGRTRHSQVTHYYFEGCQYYQPLSSYGGYRHLKIDEWVR